MKPRTNRFQSDIFVWSGKYQVGIAKVDQQHKKLVALINALAKKLADQADADALMSVFDDLASYANYHFKTEEHLMQEWQIDAEFETAHKDAHASFVHEVTKARNFARNNPQQMSAKTLTFLSRWLILHILGTDMRMANEIIALERGLTPKEARQRAIEKTSDSHEVLLQAMSELYESLACRTQDFLLANRRLKEELAFHQQAEADLRKLSLAVEHSPVPIFITNTEGVFEYVNPKFVEATGYRMDELAGQTPRILKSGEMPDEAYARFWTAISGKSEWFGEFHNRRKNGTTYWGKTSVTPIRDAQGAVTHYLTIQEDITERKLSEEELNRSHAQLQASLSISQDQSRDLSLLNETAELLQTCETEAEACRAVAQMAERFALGVGGALAVAGADGAKLETVATWGADCGMPGSFDATDCWAIRRGQTHEVTHPANGLVCGHFAHPPQTPYLCLPLVVRGQTLGLLCVIAAAATGRAQLARLSQLCAALGNAFKLAVTNIRLAQGLRDAGRRRA